MANIRCPVREAAHIIKDKPALVRADGVVSYAELDQLVTGTAARLAEAGVGEGDRVGLRLEAPWLSAILQLALPRRGAIACPVSTRWPDAAVAEALSEAGCRGWVTDDGTGSALGPDRPPWSAGTLVSMFGAAEEAREATALPLSRPATLVWTSGSSGEPKAVLLTIGNHYYNALGSNRNLRLGSADRWLLSLPLYHVGGLGILWRCLLVGAAVAFPDPGDDLDTALTRLTPTHLSLVPTQLRRLLRTRGPYRADRDPRCILLGGAPAPEDLPARAAEDGWPVYSSYGLTEMASQVATTTRPVTASSPRTVGPALRHRELRLADDGEILVRGQTRFAGYWRKDQSLETPFDDDGWFATGDLGEWDPTGGLSVIGRKDNRFFSGGENIHPEEIERVLGALPGVNEAVVIPVEDSEFGRRPVAVIWADDPIDELSGLAEQLAPILPRFKIPDRFLPWPASLRGTVKPDRVALARWARDQVEKG